MYFALFCYRRVEMRRGVEIIALLGLIWVLPVNARAHPMLERAVAAYEAADFQGALRTFDTAARNADLSVEELLRLFELRALVHHALGEEEAMRADLRRLIAVRGSYQLGRLAPPSVRTAFNQVREAHAASNGVELRIKEKRIEGATWMVASVLRVPDDLVDHTTLQCSIDNDSSTVSHTSQGTSTRVRLPASGAHHGCSATARTRQGGVLFSATIDGLPVLQPPTSSTAFQMPQHKPQADTARAETKKKWPWIVAAAGVVVAGGVTAAVLLSRRSTENGQPEVGGLTVSW